MSNEVGVALIIGGTSILTGLITTVGLVIIAKLNSTKAEIGILKTEINGRMTELLNISKAQSREEGNKEGRAEQTAERKDENDSEK